MIPMRLLACCLPLLLLLAACKPPAPAPQPERVFYPHDQFVMGADLSYVNQLEAYGAVYRDSGKAGDPFVIFRSRGANLVRVRLWHTPQWVADLNGGTFYSGLADVTETIRRAKAAGMAVSLDLHYSDEWADPGRQNTPAAWAGLPYPVLQDSVYQYTRRVLDHLAAQGLTPEYIQVGNETNPGMLHPAGQIENGNWQPFAGLLRSGIRAVRDFSATSAIQPRIILHVAQLQHAGWWADGVIRKGGVTDFDIIGISHYFKWSTVSSMGALTDTLKRLKSAWNKDLMIVETAFPWTEADADSYTNILTGGYSPVYGYSATPIGQLRYLSDLTQAIIDGGGSGLMYWEPAWITSGMRDPWGTGSSWDNNTLFDADGDALEGMNFMTKIYKF
jgi:arabinogalactan endo-1,4-beta-galactosidase